MARTPASATSLRRDRSRSYGLVARSASRPTAVRLLVDALGDRRGRRHRGSADRTPPRARPIARRAARRGSGRRTRRSRRARRSSCASVGCPASGDPPLGRAEEAVEVLHERRLARAVLAEDRDRFARLDGQRDAADGLDAARVAMDEVLDGDPDGRPLAPWASRPARPFVGRRPRRWPAPAAAGRAMSPAATAASSKAAARSIPAASARRTSVGGADPPADAARRQRRPRDVQRDGTSRLEHQAAVHPTEDGRIVLGAQDRRAGPRQLVEEVGDRRGPRRVELGRRFVEDEDAGAHRHDARDRHPLLLAAGQREWLAVGEVTDRQAGQRGVDPRVHLVARHAQVLEPERELLADGQLRGRQLVGRRGEDDPDLAEERAGCRGRRVGAFDDDPTVELGPDDARDEPGRGERQRRLAGAGPAGDADALAATRSAGRSPRGCARAVPDSGRRVLRSAAGSPSASRRHRPSPSQADDPERDQHDRHRAGQDRAAAATDRSAGRRRRGRRSAPVAPRTRAPRARTSARGRRPAIRAGPGRRAARARAAVRRTSPSSTGRGPAAPRGSRRHAPASAGPSGPPTGRRTRSGGWHRGR